MNIDPHSHPPHQTFAYHQIYPFLYTHGELAQNEDRIRKHWRSAAIVHHCPESARGVGTVSSPTPCLRCQFWWQKVTVLVCMGRRTPPPLHDCRKIGPSLSQVRSSPGETLMHTLPNKLYNLYTWVSVAHRALLRLEGGPSRGVGSAGDEIVRPWWTSSSLASLPLRRLVPFKALAVLVSWRKDSNQGGDQALGMYLSCGPVLCSCILSGSEVSFGSRIWIAALRVSSIGSVLEPPVNPSFNSWSARYTSRASLQKFGHFWMEIRLNSGLNCSGLRLDSESEVEVDLLSE